MELSGAILQSEFVRSDHAQTLSERIRRRDFEWLVDVPHPTEERLQGDLFANLPVAAIDPQGDPKKARLPALIVNNTCDLQPKRSRFVMVAPAIDYRVFSAGVAKEREQKSAVSYLKSVQLNMVDELLFIPRWPDIPEGAVVYLDRLSTMSSAVYEEALVNGHRVGSFSQSGFYYLLMKMTRFLARAETSDIDPRVD